jgi:hypothetical protein
MAQLGDDDQSPLSIEVVSHEYCGSIDLRGLKRWQAAKYQHIIYIGI